MTTVEAAFDGDRIRLWVNGRRLRLIWAASALMWAGVAVDYVLSQRRGLRR